MERRYKRREQRRRRWIWGGIGALILLVAIGFGIYFMTQGRETPPQSVPDNSTPAPENAVTDATEPTEEPEQQSTPAATAGQIAEEIWTQYTQPAQVASSDTGITATSKPTIEPTEEPTVEPTAELRLSGVKIGIDPGHQKKANSEKEPIAPDSSKKKAKVSSGTQGVKTRVPEYELVLDVSLQLREALEAQGAEVYMTRESNDVDISNIERAQMMNELGVDLVLRIHCDGSEDKSVNGIGLFIRKTGTNADECLKAAEALLPAMVEATGAKKRGITRNDTYTGLNWSEVPSILVEMGYMSNPEEDVLLNDPEYQAKLVEGMVEGIADYMGR